MFDILVLISRYFFVAYILIFLLQGALYIRAERSPASAPKEAPNGDSPPQHKKTAAERMSRAVNCQRGLLAAIHVHAYLIIAHIPGSFSFDAQILAMGAAALGFHVAAMAAADMVYKNSCRLLWNCMQFLLTVGLIMLQRLGTSFPALPRLQLTWFVVGFAAVLAIPFALRVIPRSEKLELAYLGASGALLAIPLVAACIVYAKPLLLKLCALGITGMLILNLLATYSRGCYMALAVGAFVFVLIIKKQLVVLFVPALLMLPFVLPATVVNRLFSIFNPTDTSTIFRLNIWRGTLRMLADFWPVGVGQGEYAFNMVYTYYSLGAIFTPHSHNLFMQILAETGIVGLFMFLGVLACFYRAQANFLMRVSEFRLRVMSAAMIAAVTGFLFQGIFDHAFYSYRVMMAFFLFVGISIAFTRNADARFENEAVETPASKKSMWVRGYHD